MENRQHCSLSANKNNMYKLFKDHIFRKKCRAKPQSFTIHLARTTLPFIWIAKYWLLTPLNIITNLGIIMFMAFWHILCTMQEQSKKKINSCLHLSAEREWWGERPEHLPGTLVQHSLKNYLYFSARRWSVL